MAVVQSLGVHAPSALPYLVSEGILPSNPSPSSYRWQSYPVSGDRNSEADEELLITDYCVVWSRAGIVERIFRFEIEKEPVTHAVLANFSGQHDAKSHVHASTEPVGPSPDVIAIPKRRRTGDGEQKLAGRRRSASTAAKPARKPDQDASKPIDDGRAVVVLLQKQLHVFFIAGSSHPVHLPFPVEQVFAMPSGIVLERKVEQKQRPQATPQIPPAPQNSFALSQLTSSNFQLTPIQQKAQADRRSGYPRSVQRMLQHVLDQDNDQDGGLVSHFTLRDTVTGPEPLLEVSAARSQAGAGAEQRSAFLEPEERLIYVSGKDELAPASQPAPSASPLLLAVTVHSTTGLLTLWQIARRISQPQRRAASKPGNKPDVRKSFGPGTGAATPIARKSMGPRESMGMFGDHTRSRKMSTDDADIASQLDPAFENPRAPARSSRRISSMLARSELHGDGGNAGDFASVQSQGPASRRGPSFGSKRKSYSQLGHEASRRGPSSSYTDFGPALSELPDEEETAEESNDSDDSAAGMDGGAKQRFTRRESSVLTKVYSFPTTIRLSAEGASLQVKAFTISAPRNSKSVDESRKLVCCVVCKRSGWFYSLDISFTPVKQSRKHPRSTVELDIKVTDVSAAQGVHDACLVTDRSCTRILVLRAAADGGSTLSLSSPWSVDFSIGLPKKLLNSDPFLVSHADIRARRRDGAFKRVLSDGPDKLCHVTSCSGNGQVAIWDSKSVRHRLKLRLLPETGIVLWAMHVCESVLPLTTSEKQPVLRLWWEMMGMLASKGELSDELEWKAFVSSIFAFYVRFLEKSREPKQARSRRKGGLLRSSSGANMDLESFEEAMSRQSPVGSAKAGWIGEDAWSWLLDNPPPSQSPSSSQKRTSASTQPDDSEILRQRTFVLECLELARQFQASEAGLLAFGAQGYLPVAEHSSTDQKTLALRNTALSLHLLREELKLDTTAVRQLNALTPILAQVGSWLAWDGWDSGPSSYYMLENEDMSRWSFDKSSMRLSQDIRKPASPPSIMQYVEDVTNGVLGKSFPTLQELAGGRQMSETLKLSVRQMTPRTSLLLDLLQFQDSGPTSFIRIIGDSQLNIQTLETLPEGVAAPLRSVIANCQANPGESLPSQVLELIDRPDLTLIESLHRPVPTASKHSEIASHEAVRDFHSICNSTLDIAEVGAYDGSAELDRQLVTRLIFKDDQRFSEAARILHPLKPAIAKCEQEPDWSDVDYLEAQQELAKVVAMRTLSVSPGRAMIYYNARYPLITEKFPIHGFSLSCVIKPANATVTADKSIYTEEKVSWAFFHAGVEAGLSISKDAKGIDTSWIGFNKPVELQNRHAGFMLALGLNGHLKTLAKWFAFKSFTAKHTMTSIGLLIGLAASFMGTMDTQITRLISVHVARLLPPNSAELNLSPIVQTAGMMSLGLLYCNSQHRRMSEIMLSEIESEEQEDVVKPMENLRDEGYRTAAGFALGFINVGQGKKLKALRDMRVIERLLTLATATKRVDIVHILDKATAAAVVATALIFMKTEDLALAKKIDIPDTVHQFEYVRPDIFLLRTVARHLIMWKEITPTSTWIREQVPPFLRDQAGLDEVQLHSNQLPLLNIVAGLCLAIGLRFAGSARHDVRDVLINYLHRFMRIVAGRGQSYDERLTRTTARNCQDVVALAAAAVMAGTGDIALLRYLRVLHGRNDADTHYGSHLAAHQAIGVLFLGGGTHTFKTSNVAVAALLCAFYPLFPTSVLDNKCFLQAFRHLWVLAAEPRCLVVRAVETQRPVSLRVNIVLISGLEISKTAPCLLPELDVIARITADDMQHWPSSLDLAHNPAHLAAFRRHQSLFVRRRGAFDAGFSVFSAATRALNARHRSFQARRDAFEWVFALPSLRIFDHGDRALVLPADGARLTALSGRGTSADDRLALERGCLEGAQAERLWSLRLLFAWEDKVRRVETGEIAWLSKEAITALRAKVALAGMELGE